MRLDVGRPAMHQPVPYGVKIPPDFMALQPFKENLPSGIMIRQVNFAGGKLMARLIFCLKIAVFPPRSRPIPLLG